MQYQTNSGPRVLYRQGFRRHSASQCTGGGSARGGEMLSFTRHEEVEGESTDGAARIATVTRKTSGHASEVDVRRYAYCGWHHSLAGILDWG